MLEDKSSAAWRGCRMYSPVSVCSLPPGPTCTHHMAQLNKLSPPQPPPFRVCRNALHLPCSISSCWVQQPGARCYMHTLEHSCQQAPYNTPKSHILGGSPLTIRHELPCWLQQPEPRAHMHTAGHRLAIGSQQLLLAAGQHKARRDGLQVRTQHGAVCSYQAAAQHTTNATAPANTSSSSWTHKPHVHQAGLCVCVVCRSHSITNAKVSLKCD